MEEVHSTCVGPISVVKYPDRHPHSLLVVPQQQEPRVPSTSLLSTTPGIRVHGECAPLPQAFERELRDHGHRPVGPSAAVCSLT